MRLNRELPHFQTSDLATIYYTLISYNTLQLGFIKSQSYKLALILLDKCYNATFQLFPLREYYLDIFESSVSLCRKIILEI